MKSKTVLWILPALFGFAVVGSFTSVPKLQQGNNYDSSSQLYVQLWNSRRDDHHSGSKKNAQRPTLRGSSPSAAELSRSLAQMEAKYDISGKDRPEMSHYINVLQAWANSGFKDGPQRAARLLERIEAFAEKPGYQHIRPTPECYQIVIQAFATNFPRHAENWLDRMEDRWKKQLNTEDMPWSGDSLKMSYNICLDSWSRWSNFSTKGRGSPSRALALIERLKKISEDDPTVGPDTFSYTSVLKACAQTGRAKDAIRILCEMEQLYDEDPLGSTVQPDSMVYSLVIHALANSQGGKGAALEAEKLLERMVRLHSTGENRNAKPNAYTYEGVITAWGKSRTGTNGGKRAEAILLHMSKLYESGNHDVKPMTMNINAVVKAWSVCRGGVEAAKKCESILRRMDPENLFGEDQRFPIWPNIQTVNSVISAWANSGTREAPYQAEKILEYVDYWNQKVPDNRRIEVTVDSYNMIIASYAKNKGKDSPRRAEALLYRLVNLGTRDDSNGDAIEKAYGMVISCWCKSSDPLSAERAEQILRILEKNYNDGLTKARPNVIIFSQVIDAWSKSRKPDAANRARVIFDQVLGSRDMDVYPNTITFNSMLNALANSNDPKAPREAKRILDKMYQLKNDDNCDVHPNSRSVISYMTCLAKRSKDNEAFARTAETLIESMMKEVQSGNKSMEPDSFAFTTAINAWVWSGSDLASKGILRIIDKMEKLYYDKEITSQPHTICYNTAVRFFIENGNLKQANSLIGRMEAAFLRGIKVAAPDRLTYAALLNAYAQTDGPTSIDDALELFRRQRFQASAGNRSARPHNVCYNMAMACLAKSKNSQVRSRVMTILNEMKALAKEGDKDARPDTVSYSTAINVLSKSPDQSAAAQAIELLTEMECQYNAGDRSAKPNLFSFNSVLNSLSKARTKTAAMKAEELLSKMIELSKSDPDYADVKPDLLSFTSVIDAWSGVNADGAPERAEGILRMCCSANGDVSWDHPDVVAYNKVILSWARNSKPERADKILCEMEVSDKVHPDGFSYKSVLLAWSRHDRGAAKAAKILDHMEERYLKGEVEMKPDILCYKAVAAAWKDAGDADQQHKSLAKRLDRIMQHGHD